MTRAEIRTSIALYYSDINRKIGPNRTPMSPFTVTDLGEHMTYNVSPVYFLTNET